MTIIEARMPDGRLAELAEVNLTMSGLLIMITDDEGHQVLIHRYAWDNLVKAVSILLHTESKDESTPSVKPVLSRETVREMKALLKWIEDKD